MMRFCCVSFTIFSLLTFSVVFASAPLESFSFSAKLGDVEGLSITGSVKLSMTVRLFEQETEGVAQYIQVYPMVEIDDGFFHLKIGPALPHLVRTRYLELEVGGQVLSPRRQFLTLPFAVHAANSQAVGGMTTSDLISYVDLSIDNVVDSIVSSPFIQTSSNIVYDAGNLAIGNEQPDQRLVIEGKVRMSATTDPMGSAGTIRWTGEDLEVNKGGKWLPLSTDQSRGLLGSPIPLGSYQEIQTQGAQDFESFEAVSNLGRSNYLAVANHYDGTTYQISSEIYQWDSISSQFSLTQTLATSGAQDFETFTIGEDSYFAVANHRNDSSFVIDSQIYKWNSNTSQFTPFQAIPTQGASDFESFQIGGESYLAVANYEDGTSSDIDSKIYKWDAGQFVEVQTIPTHGASDWESFVIGRDTYLVVANYQAGTTAQAVDSQIYKWDGSSFLAFQAIATQGAVDFESFQMDDLTYLAVANSNDIGQDFGRSKIYSWNGTEFVEFQSILTQSATAWSFFTGKGGPYLLLANHSDGSTVQLNSKLFRFDGEKFVESQWIATKAATAWHSFQIDSEWFFAVANHKDDDVNYFQNSIIYKGALLTDKPPKESLWTETADGEIYIDDSRVGIGTEAPTVALEVVGDLKADSVDIAGAVVAGSFSGDGAGLTNVLHDGDDFSAGELTVDYFSAGTATLEDGELGVDGIIATGTIEALDFVGDGSALTALPVQDQILSGNTSLAIDTTTSDTAAYIHVVVDSVQKMFISSVGVGIGVSFPQSSLEVNGAVSATTYYGDASNLSNLPASGVGQTMGSSGVLFDGIYISRDADNNLYGNQASTHVNLGFNSETGASGQDFSFNTISGGENNAALRSYTSIGGGKSNTAAVDYATVGGGLENRANEAYSVVAGGRNNIAVGVYSGVGGGDGNAAVRNNSTVAGGADNTAFGTNSTVSGGVENRANGVNSTVVGGRGLHLYGPGSMGFRGGDNSTAIARVATNTIYFMETALCVGQDSTSCNENVYTSGVIYSTALTATGNITAAYFYGDGSNLTNLPGEGLVPDKIMDEDGDTRIITEDTADSDRILFETDGVPRLVITSNGKIGIGVDNPLVALTVNGDVEAIGFIGDGTGITNVLHQGDSISTTQVTATIFSDGTATLSAGVLSASHVQATSFSGDGSGLSGILIEGMPLSTNQTITLSADNGQALIIEHSSAETPGTTKIAIRNLSGDTFGVTVDGDIGFFGHIRRLTSTLYGNQSYGHTNFGDFSETGEMGQNRQYATVGGGSGNRAILDYSTISGGQNNIASGIGAFIGGGVSNQVGGDYSVIPGGSLMTLDADDAFAFNGTGVLQTVTSGMTGSAIFMVSSMGIGTTTPQSKLEVDGTVIATAFDGDGAALTNLPTTSAITSGNTTIEIDTITGGSPEHIHVFVDSVQTMFISSIGVGIGVSFPQNSLEVSGTVVATAVTATGNITATAFYGDGSNLTGLSSSPATAAGTVGVLLDEIYISRDADNNFFGPNANTHVNLGVNSTTGTSGQDFIFATVSGGQNNTAGHNYSSIGGGKGNTASLDYSVVGGGESNHANGGHAVVSGGRNNVSVGNFTVVAGGDGNVGTGTYSTVGGGSGNTAFGNYSTVSGGKENNANGLNSAIVGGRGLYLGGPGSMGFRGGDNSSQIVRTATDTIYFMETALCIGEDSTSCNESAYTSGVIYSAALTATGNVTAAYFYGDGSNLTNLPAGDKIADTDGDTSILVEETPDGDQISMLTDGVERIVITSTGKVGIGVTSPTNSLDVAGGIKSSGTIEAQYFRHSTPVMFRVHRTTDQSISSTNETTVDFTAEAFDLGSNFDLTSDSFTAPVSGVYWFSATARDTGGADGNTFRVKFRVNGAVDMQHYCRWVSSNDISCRVEGLINLNANQEVAFIVHHDDSGGISLKGNSGSTFFQGRLIEPTD
jgi:hypothetical protein